MLEQDGPLFQHDWSLPEKRAGWTQMCTEGKGYEDTQGEDDPAKGMAKFGSLLLQATDHLGLPEAERGKGGFSPRGFKEHGPVNNLF